METLINLESFVRAAELGSFSAAARRLSLTPAAVSRNVALLERNLGARLFLRSTRKLTLTEAGERLFAGISANLDAIQVAVSSISSDAGTPTGVLKVSLPPSLGVTHILPLLPDFLVRYPQVRPEWYFENRPVDLIAEGYDAAIGGGFELVPGLVSRSLAPAHIIAVAAPAYMSGRRQPTVPTDLIHLNSIVARSAHTGRIRHETMRDASGRQVPANQLATLVMNDSTAMREAALLGLGVTLLAVPDVLPWLQRGELVRVLPKWFVDLGKIHLYYADRDLLPGKTKAFVEFVVDRFKQERLAERFDARLQIAL